MCFETPRGLTYLGYLCIEAAVTVFGNAGTEMWYIFIPGGVFCRAIRNSRGT